MEDSKLSICRLISLYLSVLSIFMTSLTSWGDQSLTQYDGEVVTRDADAIEVKLHRQKGANKSLRASVFSIDKMVYLPGSKKSIVHSWRHVGEIQMFPPFTGVTEAWILSEAETLSIQPGNRIVLTQNQPPKFDRLTVPRTAVPPGTKVMIQAIVTDPENEGINLSWKTDSGKWISERSRSSFNYFIAPEEEGEAHVNVRAIDSSGGVSSVKETIYIGNRSRKDLYQFKHNYIDRALEGSIVDALVNSDGQTIVLQKSSLNVYGAKGYLQKRFKGIFQTGTRLAIDKSNNIYVLDKSKRSVFKVNSDGKLLATYTDLSEQGDVIKIIDPVDMAIDKLERLFLLDKQLCRLFVFDSGGNLIASLGAKGSNPSQFVNPISVTVDKYGSIIVLDTGDLKLKVFSSSFAFEKAVSLSERFTYQDIIYDPVENKIIILSNLKEKGSSKNRPFIIEWKIKKEKVGKSTEVKPNTGTFKYGNLDLNGNIICSHSKIQSLSIINPSSGIEIGQFLHENISKFSHLDVGSLGSIYFQSGKKIKRLNYFGVVDKVYKNSGNLQFMSVDDDEGLYVYNKGSKKIKIYDHLGQHIKDVALKLENRQKVLGMGVDSKKNIYLMTYPTKIIIVDVNGVVIKSIDLSLIQVSHKGKTLYAQSFGVFHVDKRGNVYLIDKKKKVLFIYKSDFEDNKVLEGPFAKSKGISVDLYGNMYVLNQTEKIVYKYSSKGFLKREIILKGQSKKPYRIAAFGDGELLVYDDLLKSILLYQ